MEVLASLGEALSVGVLGPGPPNLPIPALRASCISPQEFISYMCPGAACLSPLVYVSLRAEAGLPAHHCNSMPRTPRA